MSSAPIQHRYRLLRHKHSLAIGAPDAAPYSGDTPKHALERLYVATLVNTIGGGAWFTCWAIFFTRSVGLSPGQFGVGVSVAALLGLVVGGPLGFLADRVGAREVLVVLGVVEGLAVLAYTMVHTFGAFFVVAVVAITAERTRPGIRVALLSGLTSGPERLRCLSTNRVVGHVGVALGSVVGAVILSVDSRAGYLTLVVLYGATHLVSAAVVQATPHVASLGDRGVRRRVLVVRDRPFLLITVFSGVLALNWGMLDSGVALWITRHTGAPAWIVGAVTGLNAVAIVLFQRQVSRAGATVAGAARLAVYCGGALAVSCLLFAATYHGSGVPVVVLLLVATAAQVVGELLYMASAWGLSVGLTPREDAHGEYQGVFGAGPAAALMLAPALMTTLVVGWGVAGWLVLAGLFVGCGVPLVPLSRWALRSGPRAGLVGAT